MVSIGLPVGVRPVGIVYSWRTMSVVRVLPVLRPGGGMCLSLFHQFPEQRMGRYVQIQPVSRA